MHTGHRWLIIPVEIKHREFLSRIILSVLAVSRGYRVLLGKDTMIRRLAPALPRGVLFDKSLGLARHGKPQRFSRLGYKVVVMDEETTGYYGSPETILKVRLARETLDHCHRWYCISEMLREDALKHYPVHHDRFVTTGLIRTDTWQPDFHGFYEAERQELKQRYGKFILFNSNFGGIIHARGDAFVQKQIQGQTDADPDVVDRMARIFAEGRPNLEAFSSVVPKLAEWFPDYRIVVRPHPSEAPKFWHEQFSGNEQITVSNEGAATPWILASDMMLHHGCTTGIEADILGKPNVMYAPFPDSHHDTEVMQAFVPIVKSEDALKDYITANLGKTLKQVKDANKETYFANLSGKFVSEHMLDDIDTLSFVSGDLPQHLPIPVRLRLWLATNKRRSDREQVYIKQKWPGVGLAEVDEAIKTAANALGHSKAIASREVYDQVFEISGQ